MQEIAPGLYRITISLSFGLDSVHTFAAVESGRVTLFDTGPDVPPSLLIYEDALARIGRSVADVERIFVTHFHVDHCGLAGRIKEISGAEIRISEIEYEAAALTFQGHRQTDLIREFWRQHGVDTRTIDAVCAVLNGFTFATAPFTTDLFLTDNETIAVGGRSFRVLSTPGHTRGHVCFYLPEEQILLAGDNILPHITPNLSPNLSCPSFLPLENFIRSLERIEDLPVRMVYPAHGEPFPDLKGRVAQIKRHHVERTAITLEHVTLNPRTARDISGRIFGDDLSAFDNGLAVNETYAHLMQLEKEGLIEQTQKNEMIFFKKT